MDIHYFSKGRTMNRRVKQVRTLLVGVTHAGLLNSIANMQLVGGKLQVLVKKASDFSMLSASHRTLLRRLN